MNKIRLGIIGLGYIGKVHAEALRKIEDCDLVAVCDADEKNKSAAEALETGYYRDYQEMIQKEKLDGAVLALPNNLHASVGIECIKKGLHLLIEKPITTDLAEADLLIEEAGKNGIQILVGHHRRFSPLVEMTRKVIAEGGIGKLIGVSMFFALLKPPEYFQSWKAIEGGGPILMNLIHDIDNLRYICGDVTRVYAEVGHKGRGLKVEDSASIVLRMENGALANVFLSDCVPANTSYEGTTGENPNFFNSPANCYHFFGTEASILFPQMKKLSYPDSSKVGWEFPIFEEEIKVTREDPITRELRHFCKVVAGEEAPRTSAVDGRRTLEVILAVKKSAEAGQPISLG